MAREGSSFQVGSREMSSGQLLEMLGFGTSCTSWVRVAETTVLPRFTRPESGAMRPSSRRSRVDLPAPLTPTTPSRSPGARRRVTSSRIGFSPSVRLTCSRSRTSLPSRAVAIFARDTESRGAGTSSMMALAASMRNFGLDVRAGAPRRSQASSFFTSC